MHRFPEHSNVRYVAVSGFIFLRFFAAAILGPKLFGLWDDNVDDKTARTLTLCAKTLQNAANMVEFGNKEPFMLPMNSFLQANFARIMRFIDVITVCLCRHLPVVHGC